MKKLTLSVCLIILSTMTISGYCLAAEYPTPFKVKSLFISSATNFHFRVFSDQPQNWHCTNGPRNGEGSWSFVNEADSGAVTMMQALQAAFLTGKTVKLVTMPVVVGGTTYCQILEVGVY